jgi:hypothetical protein
MIKQKCVLWILFEAARAILIHSYYDRGELIISKCVYCKISLPDGVVYLQFNGIHISHTPYITDENMVCASPTILN